MWKKLRASAQALRRDAKVYQLAVHHPKTPRIVKALLKFSLKYGEFVFDIIPDFIPVIGKIDDALLVPPIVTFAISFIPQDVLEDCYARVGKQRRVRGMRMRQLKKRKKVKSKK